MKRLLLCAVVAVMVVVRVAALVPDFGVIATSRGTYDPAFTEPAIPVLPVVRTALWLTLEGTSETTGDSLWFSAVGSYTYELDDPVYLDLERFQLRSSFPIFERTVFDMEVGRFPFRDFSAKVLSHPLDGFRIGLRHPAAELRFGVGTSYLVFPESSRILMSKADLARRLDPSLFPGIPRVIAQVEILFPEALLGQNVVLSGIGQQDLHTGSAVIETTDAVRDESKGGRLNTYYGGLGFSGTIFPSLYWTGFGHFGGGWVLFHDGAFYGFAPILSYLAGGSLRLAVEDPFVLRLEIGATLASGDADHNAFLEGNTAGPSLAFVAVSKTQWGLVFSPALTNIGVAEATVAVQPVRNRLSVAVTGYGFARPTTAPISEAGLDPNSTSRYLGSEVDARVDVSVFSDVSLSLQAGVFLPYAPAFTEAASKLQYRAVAELSVSL